MATVEALPDESPKYRRVPGLRLSSGRSALRLAEDHLLLCDYRTGFTERYKRFYFRDIEAITVRKTVRWVIVILIWALIGLCFFIIAMVGHWNWFLRITVGLCSLFALFGLARGPSCQTSIQTAVQTDSLPMLKRVRKTRRVLERIFPLIEQAQGSAEPVTALPTMMPATVSSTPPAPAIATTAAVVPPPPAVQAIVPVQREMSRIHAVVFFVVLLVGLNAFWEEAYPSQWSLVILVTLFGMSAVGGIVALVWQGKHRVHRGAATMIWLVLITYVIGGGGIGWTFATMNFIGEAKKINAHSPPPVAVQFPTPFQMRHMPGFSGVLWSYGVLSIILGLLGLIFVFMSAPVRRQPPPLPPAGRA